MPTAESVSVPFRNPMFDVQDVFRFYRCPITDVHIGHSLVLTKCLHGCYSTRISTIELFVCLVRQQWIVHEDAALAMRLQDNECEFLWVTNVISCLFLAESNLSVQIRVKMYMLSQPVTWIFFAFYEVTWHLVSFVINVVFSCIKIQAELCWAAASSARRSSG